MYHSVPLYDERSGFLPQNSNSSLFGQTICRTLGGYTGQAAQVLLKDNPILSRSFKTASSPASVSRFFGCVSSDSCAFLIHRSMEQACQFVHAYVDSVVLDIDSTKTDVYRDQEPAA